MIRERRAAAAAHEKKIRDCMIPLLYIYDKIITGFSK
jgi:hypothetical protein